jgi:prepilin-type processing-associated H-X9-DG protein
MSSPPYNFPTGNRFSRTDYWPFTGYHETLVSRCGGPAGALTTTAARWTGALSTRTGTPALNEGNALTSITDGTSNTLFFTEIAGRGLAIYMKGRNLGSPTSTAAYLAISPIPMMPISTSSSNSGDASQFARGAWADQNGATWLRGYQLNATNNQANSAAGCSIINVTNHAAPYSFHSGGVNTLRCDGSVFFLRESVAGPVVIAFVTRAGGETLNID